MSNYIFNDPAHRPTFSSDYTQLGLERAQQQLNKHEVKNKMEIEVKEHKIIPAGQHEGVIIKVDYREQPLRYTDYNISFNVDNERMTVKASYPTNITTDTIHGKMLSRFGLQVVAGKTVNPDVLIGTKCLFQIVNKTTLKGTFPEVMRDTLMPVMDKTVNKVIESV